MAITMLGSGSYFVRTGHLAGRLLDLLALRGGQPTARVLSGAALPAAVIGEIDPDFANGTALPQVIDGILSQLTNFQNGFSGVQQQLRTYIHNTLYSMYNIDQQAVPATAPLSQLIAGATPAKVLPILISQMVSGGYYVQPATVTAGAQTSVGSPSGNPTILLSLKNPQGLIYQLVFPEVLSFKCLVDSQSGGAPLGNETFQVSGQTAVSDPLSQLWPGGSGASTRLFALTSALNNNANGTLVVNGNFTAFSSPNVPDNFAIGLGTAGTNVLNGTGTSLLAGGGSIEFVGDSTNDVGIVQPFGTNPSVSLGVGGTNAVLTPDTIYHGCIFYKLSLASPAAGALQISLIDGSAYPGVVVTDDQTTANTASVTLSGVADALWHALPFAFRTPAILPVTSPAMRLRVRLSTPLTTGTNVFLSNLTFAPAQQLYAGGPWATIHSANLRSIAGLVADTYTITTANSYGTSGTGLMNQLFERIWGMRALGLQLPYTGSTVVADSLIV